MSQSDQDCNSSYTAEYLFRVTDASFRMEVERYESLSSMASRLLTVISILSVTATAVIALVAGSLIAKGLLMQLCVFGGIAFFALLIALVFALISQMRFTHLTFNNPKKYADTVGSYETHFPDRLMAARKYAEEFDDVFDSVRSRNETVRKYLKASMISIFVALASAVVGAISLLSAALAYGAIA